jgi:hypothetical protein
MGKNARPCGENKSGQVFVRTPYAASSPKHLIYYFCAVSLTGKPSKAAIGF